MIRKPDKDGGQVEYAIVAGTTGNAKEDLSSSVCVSSDSHRLRRAASSGAVQRRESFFRKRKLAPPSGLSFSFLNEIAGGARSAPGRGERGHDQRTFQEFHAQARKKRKKINKKRLQSVKNFL